MSKKTGIEIEKAKSLIKADSKIIKNFSKTCLFSDTDTKPGSADKPS